MKKKFKIFIVLIIILFILFGIYLFKSKNNNENKTRELKKTTKKALNDKWFTPNGESLKMNIYYDEKNNLYEVINEFDSYNYNLSSYKLINSYRCSLESCESYQADDDSKKVIIKDDGYYIYDFINNKAKKINVPEAYYKNVEILSYSNKIYGLSFANINDKYAFYSYDKEKFITSFDYDNILSNEKNCLINGNFIVTKNNKFYVINYNSLKILKESDNYIGTFGTNEVTYYYENYSDEETSESLIYDSSFKKILKNNLYKLYSNSKKGNLIVKNPKKESFIIYNKNGVKIKESKVYKEVLDIINENIIVVDNDNYLKVVDIDGNIKASIMEFNNNSAYDKSSSKVIDNKIYFKIMNMDEEENNYKIYYYDTKSMKKGVLNY